VRPVTPDIRTLLAPFDGGVSEPFRPSELSIGDSIRFLLESIGCFSHDAWILEWSSAKSPFIDIQEVIAWEAGALGQRHLGVTRLSAAEVVGLDAMLDLYRLMKGKNVGRSTTREHLFVEYVRNGAKVGEEEFDDSVCHFLVADQHLFEDRLPPYLPLALLKGATSLGSLAQRARAGTTADPRGGK